ncbi:MAG TPA: porin [Kofleriaceae bacterium]|nr:porin [Kofleriaceae bacterium]
MQRLLILFLSIASFASAARAQPAGNQPPAEPPSPSSEPATAPTTAPPDAARTPDIPPPPPVTAAKPTDELPKRLSVGKDSPGAFLNFGVNFQGWFVYDETVRKGMTEDVNLSTSTFRIRRLELALGGEIIPKFVRYRAMFDPSRVRDTLTTFTAVNAAGQNVTIRAPTGSISTLQDFYITFLSDVAEVSIGQFKNQVSWDGFNSAAKIIMPERAFIANLVGGQRDLGIRIDKTFPKFMYSIGFFNGAGQNNLDTNNEKQVGLRLEVYPVKGLTIAGVTYDSLGYRSRAGTKDRWEGDLRYENANFLFQSEFIRTRDVFADGAKPVNTQGLYAALAYTLKGVGAGNMKGDLQPVVRVGYYDPNIDADVDPSMVAASNFGGNDERTDFEVGLNYYLRGHEMKLQLSYDRQQFDQSDIKPANNEVIFATQVWY